MKRRLEWIEVPDEHDARERAWRVVSAAFAEREPEPTPRRRARKPVAALATALVVVAGLLSPPGRAVVDRLREAVGVEGAAPALFSLPAAGQLLVTSDAGTWVVRRDGSRRLIGRYDEASWSPHGRFVVASRRNELAALEPDGDVRWKLARPEVTRARWGGTRSDTRVAYLSGTTLRVVAGDGTGDRELARNVAPVAPVWQPGTLDTVAYVAGNGQVRVVDVRTRRIVSRSQNRITRPIALAWSRSGRSLVALGELSVEPVLGNFEHLRLQGIGTAITAAPAGERFAVVEQLRSGRSRVGTIAAENRELFAGTGAFTSVEWSPDGRWLLLGWRDADQLVFLRSGGGTRIRAASGATAEFESKTFPRVEGWCCAD